LSPEQQMACDATGNGAISALDASRILQLKVGLITTLPVADATHCNSDWAFNPTPVAAPNQMVTPYLTTSTGCQRGRISYQPLVAPASGQDFVAILYGDCTGNWQPAPTPTPTGAALPLAVAQGSAIRVGHLHRGRSGELRLPLFFTGNTPLQGLTFDLHYDAERLRVLSMHRIGTASHALLVYNHNDPGIVRVGLASGNALPPTDKAILLVRFAELIATAPRSAVTATDTVVNE
jgi:hypothetical protein